MWNDGWRYLWKKDFLFWIDEQFKDLLIKNLMLSLKLTYIEVIHPQVTALLMIANVWCYKRLDFDNHMIFCISLNGRDMIRQNYAYLIYLLCIVMHSISLIWKNIYYSICNLLYGDCIGEALGSTTLITRCFLFFLLLQVPLGLWYFLVTIYMYTTYLYFCSRLLPSGMLIQCPIDFTTL